MDVYRLLLVSKMKKSSILANYTENLVSLLKPKVVHLHLFLSFLTFPKFWKLNFIYFGHTLNVETELNWPHGLSIFLKYHVPLIRHFFHNNSFFYLLLQDIIKDILADGFRLQY